MRLWLQRNRGHQNSGDQNKAHSYSQVNTWDKPPACLGHSPARPHTLKQIRQLPVPLIPIVSTRNPVKFMPQAPRGQKCCELAVGREQTVLVATRQIKIWRRRRTRRTRYDKRIVAVPRGAIPRAEAQLLRPILLNAFDGECTARNVDRGAQPSREDVKIGMTQAGNFFSTSLTRSWTM